MKPQAIRRGRGGFNFLEPAKLRNHLLDQDGCSRAQRILPGLAAARTLRRHLDWKLRARRVVDRGVALHAFKAQPEKIGDVIEHALLGGHTGRILLP